MKGFLDNPPAIAVVALGLIIIGTAINFAGGLFGMKGMGNMYVTIGLLIIALIVTLVVLAFLARRES